MLLAGAETRCRCYTDLWSRDGTQTRDAAVGAPLHSALMYQKHTSPSHHPSSSEELPSRWKWAGRDLHVHYNRKPRIFYCITMSSHTALMNFCAENHHCKHNCTAHRKLWQLCWWDSLTGSAHWDLSGQPMTADNRTSSPAEGEEISWTVYLGSKWRRQKDNAELNNNLARSSQNWGYLFIFN